MGVETAAAGPGGGAGRGGAFRRVLVGFDGSPSARDALRAGVALAEELRGDLRVLVVVRPPVHAETPEEAAQAASADRENLSAGLDAQARPTGGAIDRRVVVARDPGHALAQHAAEHGFDIVVVGGHGREQATHRGMGQALEALLRARPCPVLVV